MQGDIIISEPKAIVGFAGKRVIEQTMKKSYRMISNKLKLYRQMDLLMPLFIVLS